MASTGSSSSTISLGYLPTTGSDPSSPSSDPSSPAPPGPDPPGAYPAPVVTNTPAPEFANYDWTRWLAAYKAVLPVTNSDGSVVESISTVVDNDSNYTYLTYYDDMSCTAGCYLPAPVDPPSTASNGTSSNTSIPATIYTNGSGSTNGSASLPPGTIPSEISVGPSEGTILSTNTLPLGYYYRPNGTILGPNGVVYTPNGDGTASTVNTEAGSVVPLFYDLDDQTTTTATSGITGFYDAYQGAAEPTAPPLSSTRYFFFDPDNSEAGSVAVEYEVPLDERSFGTDTSFLAGLQQITERMFTPATPATPATTTPNPQYGEAYRGVIVPNEMQEWAEQNVPIGIPGADLPEAPEGWHWVKSFHQRAPGFGEVEYNYLIRDDTSRAAASG